MARAKAPKLVLPSLTTGPVCLVDIREQQRQQLIDAIDTKRGRKALILDPTVSGPLSLIDANLTELLTEHGVAKLLYLEDKPLDDPAYNPPESRLSDIKTVVYIVRATLENAQLIAAQIKNRPRSAQQQHEFNVFFVPRRTITCEKIFEEEGISGDMWCGELAVDLVAIDDDVLSLELGGAFAECVVDGDPSSLHCMARAMLRLQAMFGLIPRIQGKGPAASAVREMCSVMLRDQPTLVCSQVSREPKIQRAVLLDREVDLVTPMMTQITFEGLIDEVTGIQYGAVPWTPKDRPASEASSSEASTSTSAPGGGSRVSGGKGSTLLNSADEFYREFRDLPYATAVQRLKLAAKDAQREYSELGSKDLSQLKVFVKGLPKVMALDRLTDVASPVADAIKSPLFHTRLRHELDCVEGLELDNVLEFLEELMCRGEPLVRVLRLLMLVCACQQGLPRKQYDHVRHMVLATYGHQHLLTLNRLEKSGLLRPAGTRSGTFQLIRKGFDLIVDQPESQIGALPTDISHLYNGYAPLSVRLVEAACGGGWTGGVAETVALLPGPHFDVLQAFDTEGNPNESAMRYTSHESSSMAGSRSSLESSHGRPSSLQPQHAHGETVLVVFVGGVTFSEISALRLLGKRSEPPVRFLVLTTKMVSGNSLMQSFVDPLAEQALQCVGLQPADKK